MKTNTPNIRHADPILRTINRPGCVTPEQMAVTRQQLREALLFVKPDVRR